MLIRLIIALIFSNLTLNNVVLAQAPEVEGPPINEPVAKKVESGFKPFSIELIEADASVAASTVSIRFDRKIEWPSSPKIEDHGTFIQIILEKTTVPTSGQFYDGAGSYIAKVAAFQLTPEDGAIRLFLTKDAEIIHKGLTLNIEDDKLTIALDHAKLEGYGLSAHVATDQIPGTPPVEDIVANTKVRSDINDPATIASLAADTDETPFFKKSDLSDRMIGIAIFSASMIIGLGLFHFVRRTLGRRDRPGNDQGTSMKLVSTFHLAPKQQLTLMDVGGEQILLGVSPDGIKFLTAVRAKETGIHRDHNHFGPPIGIDRASPLTLPPKTPTTAQQRSPSRLQSGTAPEPNQRPRPQVTGAVQGPRTSSERGSGRPEKSQISVRIDDDGIHQNKPTPSANQGVQALEDVTRLIRSKLKNLP